MTTLSRRVFGLAAIAGLAALAACNLENIEAPGLAKDKDAAAREVYKVFASGDVSSLRSRFGPEMQGPEAEAAFPQISALIPRGEPTKSRLASWKSNWTALSGPRTENLVTTHEYSYPDVVVVAETVMTRDTSGSGSNGPWMVRGFHIKRNPVGGATAPAAPAQPSAAADSNEFVTPEQAAAEEGASSASGGEQNSNANNRR